jgi:hypothetical protein
MDGSNMDGSIQNKFESYPEAAKDKLLKIRTAIFEVAAEESLGNIVESLKWNEPSYLSKSGSAIRIDWKQRSASTISVYFNCKTNLIDTFREIYPDTFSFSGNREIVFQLDTELPVQELKACISMALGYQKIKHLPLLGE